MLFAPLLAQGYGNLILPFPATTVPEAGQCHRVALALNDCIENSQTGHSGNIANGMMQQYLHLVESFLDALHVLAASFHKAFAMAH